MKSEVPNSVTTLEVILWLLMAFVFVAYWLYVIGRKRNNRPVKKFVCSSFSYLFSEALIPLGPSFLMLLKQHSLSAEGIMISCIMYVISLMNALKNTGGLILGGGSFLGVIISAYFEQPTASGLGTVTAKSFGELCTSCSAHSSLTWCLLLIFLLVAYRVWMAYNLYRDDDSTDHWLVEHFSRVITVVEPKKVENK